MKIALLLAANVALVAAGIVTYDVVKGSPEIGADAAAVDALTDRLGDLERRVDALGTNDGERRLSTRIVQVEQRVGALESRRLGSASAATTEDPARAADAAIGAADGAVARAAPDAADVLRALENDEEALKAVAAKIDAARDRDRATDMVNRMTERLNLQLTDEQRTKVATALTGFRESMRDRMMAARAEGLEREDMRGIVDEARAELTDTLSGFLSVQDAEAIASTVGGGPGGGPGGGMRGGPGGGR